jgi:hypothetical protein
MDQALLRSAATSLTRSPSPERRGSLSNARASIPTLSAAPSAVVLLSRAVPAAVCALLVLGGLLVAGRGFSDGCTDACMVARGYQGCLRGWPAVAAVSLTFTVPLTALAMALLIVELGRARQRCGLLALALLGTVVVPALALGLLMKPWSAFDYTVENDVNGNTMLANDVFQVYVGGTIFVLSLVLGATAALAAQGCTAAHAKSPCFPFELSARASTGMAGSLQSGAVPPGPTPLDTSSSSSSGTAGNSADSQPPRRMHAAVMGLLGLCVLLLFCCASLSPIWNYSFRSYSGAVSKFSLLGGVETAKQHWSVGKLWCVHRHALSTGRLRLVRVRAHGGMDGATAVSSGHQGDELIEGSCERSFVFKLYTDTVVFYLALAALVSQNG